MYTLAEGLCSNVSVDEGCLGFSRDPGVTVCHGDCSDFRRACYRLGPTVWTFSFPFDERLKYVWVVRSNVDEACGYFGLVVVSDMGMVIWDGGLKGLYLP